MSWSGLSAARGFWVPLTSERTTVDEGVDFRTNFHEQYPWALVEDSRGLRIYESTYSEGRP